DASGAESPAELGATLGSIPGEPGCTPSEAATDGSGAGTSPCPLLDVAPEVCAVAEESVTRSLGVPSLLQPAVINRSVAANALRPLFRQCCAGTEAWLRTSCISLYAGDARVD